MDKRAVTVGGIDHVVLHVKDLARARRFYMEVLGFTEAFGGGSQAFLSCGTQLVGLFQVGAGTPVKTGTELNHMALRLDSGSYETVTAHLESHGIAYSGRPGDPDCIYFDDPDGHRLQLVLPGAH